jgi:hypothetical protein
MFRTLLTVALALFMSAVAVRAQTVDEIIAKNVQAHGGMEKMKSVQTIRMTGKFDAGEQAARQSPRGTNHSRFGGHSGI